MVHYQIAKNCNYFQRPYDKENKYLKENDLLLTGNIADILSLITNALGARETSKEKLLGYCKELRQKLQSMLNLIGNMILCVKDSRIISRCLQKITNPILIDDSQMFGGLLFEGYDKFPENLRVFGDHFALIGG